MSNALPGNSSWFYKGNKFTWIDGEHCLVLIGESATHYFFNDPWCKIGRVKYLKNDVERCF